MYPSPPPTCLTAVGIFFSRAGRGYFYSSLDLEYVAMWQQIILLIGISQLLSITDLALAALHERWSDHLPAALALAQYPVVKSNSLPELPVPFSPLREEVSQVGHSCRHPSHHPRITP